MGIRKIQQANGTVASDLTDDHKKSGYNLSLNGL
jgi:hypothetical protein